jgi:hypothetical protein
VVLATLLCCDAWLDVVLDTRTSGFELSLLSAVVIERPLAILAGWVRGACCSGCFCSAGSVWRKRWLSRV